MTTPKGAGGQHQSMIDGLQKMLGELAQMQALPDADVDFLSQLQQVIVGRVRAGLQGSQGAGGQPGQPGQPPGPPGGPQQPSPSPMGGPAMGLSQTGAGAPNMDELSRVLGSAGQTG